MKNDALIILNFINYAEKLKVELRHASKSDDSHESVADHCWRLSLMLVLVVPKLKIQVDLLKILKMAIIHDLAEIEARDVPLLTSINDDAVKQLKQSREEAAMQNVRKLLGKDGDEIFSLWSEFEKLESNEARVLKALDRLEGELQFLNESVTKFTAKDRKTIEVLLDETTELSKIDPFLEKLDELSYDERVKRIQH